MQFLRNCTGELGWDDTSPVQFLSAHHANDDCDEDRRIGAWSGGGEDEEDEDVEQDT